MNPILVSNRQLFLGAIVGLLIFSAMANGCSAKEDNKDPDRGIKDLAADTAKVKPDAPQVTPDQPIAAPDRAAPDLPATDIDKTQPIHLTNADNNCEAVMLSPNPGEEGHLCAGRLTPPGYPFKVNKVGYRLGHGKNVGSNVTCNGSLAHQVQLYISSDITPPAQPVAPVILTAPYQDPATIPEGDGRTVTLDVNPPVTLSPGEHLFVAIKFAGTHPDVMCVATNEEDPFEGNRNYWSNAAAPPYSWVQLNTFGLQGTILVRAIGTLQ